MKDDYKLNLKGSYTGVNKFKKLEKYDIIKSVILKNICKKNKININVKNNKVYIYH